MLTLSSGQAGRDCSGLWRRDFLRVGALGLGSLSLPWLLRSRAAASDLGRRAGDADFVKDRSVVFLFLGGGASHIETFNPNMDQPEPYRSVTGEVPTTIPGVSFGGTFPLLARQARRLAIVRSFRHSVGSHPQAIVHVLSGGTRSSERDQRGFSIGSAYASVRGASHPVTGLPTYALLTAPEKDSQYRTERQRVRAGSTPGTLGPVCSPFDPEGGGTLLDNMTLNMPAERLGDRMALLGKLDRLRRDIDASGVIEGMDRFTQQAVDVVLRGASDAFDLSNEDPRLVERYDTGMFTVGNKARRPKDVRPSVLGRQMLMARRLCEAGCGFVTVQSAGWDNHADGNNPGIKDGMEMLGPPLDKAVSAFLEDLEARGLSDKVLLVISGDFGRTPKINKSGGRDHWTGLCTLAFAGGGLNVGQVIGRCAPKNDVPATEPVTPEQLMATALHALFDIGRLRLEQSVPRDVMQIVERAEPIPGLV